MKNLMFIWIVLVFPATAAAHTTIVSPEGSEVPYQKWIDRALVPTPNVTIILKEEPCPNPPSGTPRACTIPVTIWFEWWMPKWARRSVFYHEIGHNFDYVMPDWARYQFMKIMHLEGAWDTNATTSPNEIFADTYSLCARQPFAKPGDLIDHQEPTGGWRNYNRACYMIVNVYREM